MKITVRATQTKQRGCQFDMPDLGGKQKKTVDERWCGAFLRLDANISGRIRKLKALRFQFSVKLGTTISL